MVDGYRIESGGTGRRSERSAYEPSVDLTETGSSELRLRPVCRRLVRPARHVSLRLVAAAGRCCTHALADPL